MRAMWAISADVDVDLFHYDINITNKNTETVLEVSKEVRLEINAEITKQGCVFMSCHQSDNKVTE
jgi:hypothetical protein